MNLPLSIRVETVDRVGEARRLAGALCRELGFAETRTGEAALVVAEMATNLVKHTHGLGGTLVFRPIEGAQGPGLDILSLDKGPGIASIGESLRDGHSTAGSPGTGLGAIRRLSAEFDIYSAPGKGTAVFGRLWQGPTPAPAALPSGALCLPVQGEEACGDAWAMKAGRATRQFMVADGLGHGPGAAEAADLAVALFDKSSSSSPAELVALIHAGLRHTRGAALAVAEVPLGPGEVRFAGVGNISGLIIDGPNCRSMASHNGTAGVAAPNIREYRYPWPEGGLMVLHSDGVATHWDLRNYPGLACKRPTLIAGVLFRDHQRPKDDSTVLVVKS